jgi:hypothetical protein
MSFYSVYPNPLNFSVNDPMFSLQSTVSLMKNSIHLADNETTVNSSSMVQYTAEQLMSGRIVRTGLTGVTRDWIDSASNIISVLKAKIKSISDKDTIQNGTTFRCQLHNPNNYYLGIYNSGSVNGTYVGGQFVEGDGQIAGNATAYLDIMVNDQASLGDGHEDRVWVCISRCSTVIAADYD